MNVQLSFFSDWRQAINSLRDNSKDRYSSWKRQNTERDIFGDHDCIE